MNNQLDRIIPQLLAQGVEQGVFPGAAAAVSWKCGATRKRCVAFAGIKDSRFPQEKVTENTFFDLASLTKALSTSLILYSLINEKKISLDGRLEDFYDDNMEAEKKNITVAQLLSHSSGLIGYKPYFKGFAAESNSKYKEELLQIILAEPLDYEPGTDCQYSDLGFIILGDIIEKITGTKLEDNFLKYVTDPAGLTNDLFFLPIQGKVDSKQFAATENCPWRGRVMRAEVHDEHCFLMGGVSGHAGLFGRAGGVLQLCETVLEQWQNPGNIFSWSGMLNRGLQRQYQNQTWCLGFDTPSAQGSSGGELISTDSVGHLGYAGTSFWIDPDRELVMVLLTNRVHPSRNNVRIREFRPFFHTALINGLEK
jgi:CubicO group peptidase (beta-lactamase class C family)